jgi:hypothetical protein
VRSRTASFETTVRPRWNSRLGSASNLCLRCAVGVAIAARAESEDIFPRAYSLGENIDYYKMVGGLSPRRK